MANLSPTTGIYWARGEGLMDVPVETAAVEGASQTYAVGSPLQWSSGLLVTASANITTSNLMAGFAVFKATGTTNANVSYVVPTSGSVFIGCLQATSGGNSVDTHTLAATDLGTSYVLSKDGVSGLWYVNFSTTSGAVAVVLGLYDAVGAKNGRVYFKVLNTGTIY
jgi:hypothetical protein